MAIEAAAARLGFIGAGAITAAFVDGLAARGAPNPILLSPRSERVARDIAARVATARVAASNAEVVDGSDILFLAVRPSQVETALAEITLRPGQILCSFVIGLGLAELERLSPGTPVCRVLPLPTVALRKGPLLCSPPLTPVLDLLSGLGEIIVPETEAEFDALGAASGLMSSFFELETAVARWLGANGVAGTTGARYVGALFSGLSEITLREAGRLSDLAAEHETPGGINERTRRALRRSGWFDEPGTAMSEVRSIRRADLA
ncbi:MAG: hypothetical protein DI556_15080 [Rhodovulum sulfidophilum]|uniref:Pyrroline-5-carboxylate reductase catalytic N-terminal domain-containing protein n=1 Tax=Rhodovulum sulfidophilum TaxID=35806 RepID=A0A2W5Q042_RHOSU|nr:MAG: hypothetical protein DI556_15080 [Rhodovulum sulfidophilum]